MVSKGNQKGSSLGLPPPRAITQDVRVRSRCVCRVYTTLRCAIESLTGSAHQWGNPQVVFPHFYSLELVTRDCFEAKHLQIGYPPSLAVAFSHH